jgi:hypothetical protein
VLVILTDQIAQCNVVVGNDTFDLVKLCQMRGVRCLVSAKVVSY